MFFATNVAFRLSRVVEIAASTVVVDGPPVTVTGGFSIKVDEESAIDDPSAIATGGFLVKADEDSSIDGPLVGFSFSDNGLPPHFYILIFTLTMFEQVINSK